MAASSWVCQICGEDQPASNDRCSCGAPRPEPTITKAHRDPPSTSGEPPLKRSRWDEGTEGVNKSGTPNIQQSMGGTPNAQQSMGEDVASVVDRFALIFKTVGVLGLSKKPELNGMTAVVKEFDFAADRYLVEVEGGRGAFKLKPDNLFEFAVIGKKVSVHGLANKPELNGAKGVVRQFDTTADRYTIEVDGGLGTFKFKAAKLRDSNIHSVAEAHPTVSPGQTADSQMAPPPPPPEPSAAPPQSEPAVAGTFKKSIKIAVNQKGLIIGKGGESIKRMQQETGAYLEIETLPGHPDAPFVLIKGTMPQIEAAERLVQERLLSARDRIMRQVAQAAKNMDLSDAASTAQRSEKSWGAQEDGSSDQGWETTQRHGGTNWETQKHGTWKDWKQSDSTQHTRSTDGPWKDDGVWGSRRGEDTSWEFGRHDDKSSGNSWNDWDSNTKWNSYQRTDAKWSTDRQDAGATWSGEDRRNRWKSEEDDHQTGGKDARHDRSYRSNTWHGGNDGDTSWSDRSRGNDVDTSWNDYSRGGNKFNSEKSNDNWKSYEREDSRKSKYDDSGWNEDTGGGSGWRDAKWESQNGNQSSWRQGSW